MIKLGLIGCGYWGPNLLRNVYSLSNCQVKIVSDVDHSRIEYVRKNYPSIETTKNYKDLLNGSIDAVVIATQARTHFSLTKEALKQKKHVLVEKPLAMTCDEAEELIDLAKRNQCKLMVGHTFEYNSAVRLLKSHIQKGNIGKPYYIYSQRLNLGIVRQDIGALWNLAPHDISILLFVLDKMPYMVSAKGHDFIQTGIEDVAFLMLHFPDDVIAHVHVSWLDPSKVRKMTIVGSEKMIIYDDVSDSKIQIYDKGIKKQNIKDFLGSYDDFGKFQLIKFAGDVLFPKVDFVEPLKVECSHFLNCILNDQTPLTDGENGLKVVKILEAAQKSLEQNGANIKIDA